MKILIEQNLKKVKINDAPNMEEEKIFSDILVLINGLIMELIFSCKAPYNYQTLYDKTQILSLQYGKLPQLDIKNITIRIAQYNQLGEKLTDEDKIINLIHEYLHLVAIRDSEPENNISLLYYGFDEFFTEFITYIICIKLGPHYEEYYKSNCGYIDEKDFEFMNKLSKTVDINILLSIYFTGNCTLLIQTLGTDLLLKMNRYFDYYLEIYISLNKPKKVVNRLLKGPNFEHQRKVLDSLARNISENINMLNKEVGISNNI